MFECHASWQKITFGWIIRCFPDLFPCRIGVSSKFVGISFCGHVMHRAVYALSSTSWRLLLIGSSFVYTSLSVPLSKSVNSLTGYFLDYCYLFCQLTLPWRCPDDNDCVRVESTQSLRPLHIFWSLHLPSSVPAVDPSPAGYPLQRLHYRRLSWWEGHFWSCILCSLVCVCAYRLFPCMEIVSSLPTKYLPFLHRYCSRTRLLFPSWCLSPEARRISHHSNTTIHVRAHYVFLNNLVLSNRFLVSYIHPLSFFHSTLYSNSPQNKMFVAFTNVAI